MNDDDECCWGTERWTNGLMIGWRRGNSLRRLMLIILAMPEN